MTGNIRIVIAEDERLVALALRSQLNSHGYEVVGLAADGKAALSLCENEHPDVVLMDVQMPEMDGLEVTRILMEREPTCVVVITGKAQLDHAVEAAGAMSYIVKPLIWAQIPQVIDAARQRFTRFRAVIEALGNGSHGLQNWLTVQSAIKMIAAREGINEADAFSSLQTTAQIRHQDLVAAGRELLEQQS
jgi:two-component system, response regulator PdtaR